VTTTIAPVGSTPARSSRAEQLLLPAAFITNLGNSVQLTAASVLVFTAERTTLSVGWLFIAVAIPQMLLSLFFGRLADRFDRRTLCIIADLASAAAAVALPVWLFFGGPANLAAYLASFALAAVGALFMPASNALIKERISADRLGPFNANFEIAVQAGTLLSAAAGGFMIQFFGVRPLFLFNGVTFLASAAFLFAMGRRRVAAAATAGSPGERAETPPVENAPLVRLGLLYALGNIVIMVGNTILLVLIIQAFRQGIGILGVVDALFGIGVVIAAAAYKRASKRTTTLRIALVGYLGFAVVLALETIHVGVLMAVIPLAGLTFGLARISARTMLMSTAPEHKVGWVFGATNAFGLASGAVATVLISLLIDHTTAQYGFYVLALLVAVVGSLTIAALRRPLTVRQPVPALSGTTS
jgi:MFS family permease